MMLFNDTGANVDQSASTTTHSEPAPRKFQMPSRGITTQDAVDAVSVMFSEHGRPVTSRDVQVRFGMKANPSAYLLRAHQYGLLERSGRVPTDDDHSLFQYYPVPSEQKQGERGDQWVSSSSAAAMLGVHDSTIRAWGRCGKIKRRGKGRRTEYLVPKTAAHSMTCDDVALTLREAAGLAGESVRTLRRRIVDGRLEAFQRGGVTSPLLVTREALAAYMEGRAPKCSAEATREVNVGAEVVTTNDEAPNTSFRSVISVVIAWMAGLLKFGR